jgi:hypothetical protein
MEVWTMAHVTALSRRFGILVFALLLTLGLAGAQTVSARALPPPIIPHSTGGQNPTGGQVPTICYPCFWGLSNLQEKTLFYASNYPNLASVEMTWDFNGQAASVAYVVQAANAPAPAAGAYFKLALQPSGHYAAYQYLNKGGHYRLYVQAVDTYGTTHAQMLDFWVS